MNRKPKALGLALFAVLAIGTISASVASATNFHSEAAETVIKGSQIGIDAFTVDAGTESCKELTYAGIQSAATATTVTVTPTWSSCTTFGFVNATIDTNGCTYVFSSDTSNLKIACPEGKAIVKTVFNCWVTIHPQETTGGVTYTNTGVGSKRHLELSLNISGIHYTQHSKSFPGCTNGTQTNGKYTGSATFQGFTTAGTQVGIWRT